MLPKNVAAFLASKVLPTTTWNKSWPLPGEIISTNICFDFSVENIIWNLTYSTKYKKWTWLDF